MITYWKHDQSLIGALIYALTMSLSSADVFKTFFRPAMFLRLTLVGASITSIIATLMVHLASYLEISDTNIYGWARIPYLSICYAFIYLLTSFDGVLGNSILKHTGFTEALNVGAWGTLLPILVALIVVLKWQKEYSEARKSQDDGTEYVPMRPMGT